MSFPCAREWVAVGVCLVILCLFMSLYTTEPHYCEQQHVDISRVAYDVDYTAAADVHDSTVETEPNVTTSVTPEHPSTLPRHGAPRPTRTQVVNASEWNVFDARASKTYTLIVQTYKRNDLLKRILRHYNHTSFPLLEKIIVIWNNIDVPLDPALFQQEISQSAVPVEFVISKVNSMRNKLKPHPQIQTTAVLVIDDDLIVEAADVDFAFKVWQQFPHRIIGFFPRKHLIQPDGTIGYVLCKKNAEACDFYSIIMTGSCFLHKGYLKMFNETIPPEIDEMIERTMNCDDLAMNVMIGDYLARAGVPQPSGVYVRTTTPIQKIHFQAESGFYGVSAQMGHLETRSYCLKMLNDTYHGLPLPYSDLIVSRL